MKLKLDQQGLIPVIAQDINTGQVLTLAYTNPGALKRTLEGGQAWFYSRSRQDLWHKGAYRPRLPHRQHILLLHPSP